MLWKIENQVIDQFKNNIFFELTPTGIIICDLLGIIKYSNPAMVTLTGYSLDEILDHPFGMLLPEEETQHWLSCIESNGEIGDNQCCEILIKCKDGRLIHSNAFYAQISSENYLVEFNDVTHLKLTELALKDHEKRLTNLLSNLPGMAYQCFNDDFWTIIFASEGCYDLTGYYAKELIGNEQKAYIDLVVPEDQAMIKKYIRDSIQNNESFEVVYRIITSHGVLKWVWEKGRTVSRTVSGIEILEGFITDITSRMRAQEAVLLSERKYRELFNSFPDAILICTVDGTIKDCNPKVEAITGFKPNSLIGQNLLQLPHLFPETHLFLQKQINKMNQGKLVNAETKWSIDKNIVQYCDLMGGPVLENENITGFRLIVKDITHRKNLESDLQHSQRMEAIGRLAGGIAHDFNNLLTIIRGYTDLLLKDYEFPSDISDFIKDIDSAAKRAESLTRQLLTFSRRQVNKLEHIQLNNLIQDMMKLLKRVIGENIDLTMDLDPDLPFIRADQGQIEQVILNICINARDAMPNGGKLTLFTKSTLFSDQMSCPHRSISPGFYVKLSIQDTGTGMESAVLDKIFEPFFTTKPRTQGNGLGLATVYGIVRQISGVILVESEPDKGSRFDIYLPGVDKNPSETEILQTAPRLHNGNEKVLLVEDQKELRDLLKKTLLKYGFQVWVAPDGNEALRLIKENSVQFEIIVTDIVMPEMSGVELAEHVSKLLPETKILFMSGYYDGQAKGLRLKTGQSDFLHKPFTPKELVQSLRQLLD